MNLINFMINPNTVHTHDEKQGLKSNRHIMGVAGPDVLRVWENGQFWPQQHVFGSDLAFFFYFKHISSETYGTLQTNYTKTKDYNLNSQANSCKNKGQEMKLASKITSKTDKEEAQLKAT